MVSKEIGMPPRRKYPSPDDGAAEQALRTRLDALVTELFEQWDDPFKAPEWQLELGQPIINRMVVAIEDAAVARGLIPADDRNPRILETQPRRRPAREVGQDA
jgi:hypothetical protein